ncbi:cobalt-precorrin-6A reductase [Phreatobacter oligotrophus]|uniref:Precorrin-6A reductase n=1 Tax=Phreatobacter oligotrophus TaxID=1122261 RepID=A0A2T4YWP0_9HYPH|nr:cobalt-precorrin-6A reductase [Phreatobacter oligotrophus]PTM49091.1 precorrin-6A reductase [Phreatobacter oligotrophus]
MRHILILGGTVEARQLAGRLAQRTDLGVTLSLAGRTAQPAAQPVPVRSGGFGGVGGLADYLTAQHIDALIDATHPYAAIISRHAAEAAARTGTPILALRRPSWTPVAGDRWIDVDDVTGAVHALGDTSRRVFLTIGRNEVAAFAVASQHSYLVRSVDPIEPPLAVPNATYIVARGPFSEADEYTLLKTHRTEFVVSKNSGSDATYGKIAAARSLGITVVMLRRPALPTVPSVESVEDAVRWLDHAPEP